MTAPEARGPRPGARRTVRQCDGPATRGRGGVPYPLHGPRRRRSRGLVGDPDAGDGLTVERADHLGERGEGRGPDLVGIVLDPPGRGKCWVNSRAEKAVGCPCSFTATVLTLVVPASIAKITAIHTNISQWPTGERAGCTHANRDVDRRW